MASDALVVVAATKVEARAAQRELPNVHVCETGVALVRWRPEEDTVISCGLAGGLRHDVPSGTILIPREVGNVRGERRACDPQMVDALADAARDLGHEPHFGAMVTTPHIVRGDERERWEREGYVGVDMETAYLNPARLAAVRVVLDTPLKELSEDWLSPVTAALKPWNWPEMLWLARTAPRYAKVAAQVIARALGGPAGASFH